MKLASFGALVHGSTGHFFYNFLDSKIPGTAALTVAKKVFIDQVLFLDLRLTLYRQNSPALGVYVHTYSQ